MLTGDFQMYMYVCLYSLNCPYLSTKPKTFAFSAVFLCVVQVYPQSLLVHRPLSVRSMVQTLLSFLVCV